MRTQLQERLQDETFTNHCVRMEWTRFKVTVAQLAFLGHSIKHFINNDTTIEYYYVLWNDGEITREEKKRTSWRSRWFPFLDIPSIQSYKPPIFEHPVFLFPFSRAPFTGVVMTLEECVTFREWIWNVMERRRCSLSSVQDG